MEIARILAIYRYPIKSMAGEQIARAEINRHGIAGDRRFAFRRVGDSSSFPWLTARQLPQMLLFEPFNRTGGDLPTHVRAPQTGEFEITSEVLRRNLEAACDAEIELTKVDAGAFDAAHVSLIGAATLRALEREYGKKLDARRFRQNFIVETANNQPFEEDNWVGKSIAVGDAIIKITERDARCALINLDPETAAKDADVLKTVARKNQACAGVYATIQSGGAVKTGDAVRLV